MPLNQIQLRQISKSFEETEVLEHFDLDIEEDEFLTLLGPSGCGKTTILRLIGGFEEPDSGQILFEGRDVTAMPPHERPFNTVFQQYSLFPHMNVEENVGFGLRMRGIDPKEIQTRVMRMLDLVNLRGFNKRRPDQLSGGQKQRIAIARALVNEPEVLLLDEPLGALDLKLRKEMQWELKRMQRELGITFIFVTHDQEEALTMSDRIVVLNHGIIQQQGVPKDIYDEPANRFVADFIGDSNILDGVMLEDYKVRFSHHDFVCVDHGFAPNEPVDVVLRPEDIELVAPEKGMLVGKVMSCMFRGVHYAMEVDVDGAIYTSQSTRSFDAGQPVGIVLEPDLIHVMHKEARP
ncbi:MAG: ABC transporter ATP-binding protein [Peptoniphilaceae bacterium]|nr:ABC transporter ATP-binding protein [Peptoniphilaceae bacterium]MDY6085441.1 ABC transporter ATP-binding protein [Peptoniphilaceae bacterium]